MAREGLSGLCRGGGWTYGAIWRIDRRDPRLLVLAETYQEVQNGLIFEKLINQVHVTGQGTIGEVAISGKHRWMISDAYSVELSEISTIFKPDIFKGNVELQQQILSGIKTIAVISLPPLGVVLFGSTQKIYETSNFIGRAQHLLRQLGNKSHGYVHVGLNLPYQQVASASIISSLDSGFKNTISLHDTTAYKQRHPMTSKCSPLASGLLPLGCHIMTRSQTSSLKPCISSTPLAYISSGPTNDVGKICHRTAPFSGYLSCQIIDQQEALTETRTLFSPSNGSPHSNLNFPSNLFSSCCKSSTWLREVNTCYHLEHKPFHEMVTAGVQNVVQETSHALVPKVDDSRSFWSSSALTKSSGSGSQAVVDTGCLSSHFSEPSLYGADRAVKLLQHQHCPFSACNLATKLSPPQAFPINTELPQNFLNSQVLNPDSSMLILSDSKPTIQSCELSDQASNGLATLASYNLRDVGSTSRMVTNIGTSHSLTDEFPNMLAEAPVVCHESSRSKASNLNESTTDAPNHLVSENDLFDGMELDLSPIALQQECWDDTVLLGSHSFTDFSDGLADCISEFKMGSGKDLFPDSSFEELLDAVVSGNANLSSTCNSVRTSTNSDASGDSRHHLSTTTKAISAQGNHLPDVGRSSHTQTSTASLLPESTLKNIVQEPQDDSEQKSRVRTWVNDCCSANAECSVINQHKQPDESAKFRKRSRTGESTRPRPKDRQQIQDRIKELREIVPNAAKCSIDALLDRTIKHMLFLQSVTKYADKLNQAEEPKMIGEDSGVVLKDNTNGLAGGATWAYEVEGQTMVCPILVEDVHPIGQMLVEMLCEERGVFLEIADVVRGFGLTILKGVMEIRERKVWARFVVEASKDVTRMDIFLSLVQLLQQTSGNRSTEQPMKAVNTSISSLTAYQQSQTRVEFALADGLQC